MIGHYIIYFENSLVSILLLFYLINLVIFEKLIWPKFKECVINVSVWERNSSRPEVLYKNSRYKNFGHFLVKYPG